MMKNQEGSISVFLAAVFLVFLLFISLCTEGIYLYVGKGKAMGACMAGLSHMRGNYQKELEEMYHIFGMDHRYAEKAEADLVKKIEESLEGSQDTFHFQISTASLSDKTYLSDENGEILKYQIRELMKYEMPADILSTWKEKWDKTAASGKDVGDIREEMEEDVQKAEEEAKEGEQEEENETKQEQEDPRKGFMEMLREGSIPLVMGKRKVSSGKIPIRYGKKDTQEEETWDFMKKENVEEQLKKTEKMSSAPSLADELPGILYSTRYFHFLTSKEKKEGIQYEVEYLIAGKDSEKENLGSVLWKMIHLRFPINALYVYQDAAKKKEAGMIASSILGITGIPPLVAAAKHLLLLALAYGESIIDVRNLAEGNKVPLVKSKTSWQLSFQGLAGLNCTRKTSKNGLSYEDYLVLLLAMQKEKEEKYVRMMDVMEDNIRKKDAGFRMDRCLTAWKVTVPIRMKRLAFGGMSLPFGTYTSWKFKRTASY